MPSSRPALVSLWNYLAPARIVRVRRRRVTGPGGARTDLCIVLRTTGHDGGHCIPLRLVDCSTFHYADWHGSWITTPELVGLRAPDIRRAQCNADAHGDLLRLVGCAGRLEIRLRTVRLELPEVPPLTSVLRAIHDLEATVLQQALATA